jgi:hypothetical protein
LIVCASSNGRACQVESLPGDRVQRLRGVPDQHTRPVVAGRANSSASGVFRSATRAGLTLEPKSRKLAEKCVVGQSERSLRRCRRHGPDSP